jgi:hypothetical protein
MAIEDLSALQHMKVGLQILDSSSDDCSSIKVSLNYLASCVMNEFCCFEGDSNMYSLHFPHIL